MGMGHGIGVRNYNPSDMDETVYIMNRAAQLNGDEIKTVEIPEDEPVNDYNLIMLRAARIGQYIKNVGVKVSPTKFVLYISKEN